MALTYRKTKGSALTIDELDANFAHFTGSQSISGSTVISGSLEVDGPLYVTGSSVIIDVDNGAYVQFQVSGTVDFSRDIIVRDDLFVDDETTLRKETTIGYKDFTNDDFSYQLNVTASSNLDKSAHFDGGISVTGSTELVGLPTSDPGVPGGLWVDASANYVIKVSQ